MGFQATPAVINVAGAVAVICVAASCAGSSANWPGASDNAGWPLAAHSSINVPVQTPTMHRPGRGDVHVVGRDGHSVAALVWRA